MHAINTFRFLAIFLTLISLQGRMRAEDMASSHNLLSIDDTVSAETAIVEKAFQLPVDITFLIADLKYNREQGVKICEIQPGSVSKFSGYDYLYGQTGLVADMFCNYMAQFQTKFWFFITGITDNQFKAKFLSNGWNSVSFADELQDDKDFKKAASKPVHDSHNIADYHGIVYGKPQNIRSYKHFIRDYPGVILMDAAIYPYENDKLAVGKLLCKGELSKKLKPNWGLYPKKYTSELAGTIVKDIGSEIYVIKPVKSTKGQGVIIVPSNLLDWTLRYILTENSNTLRQNPDPAYGYWAKDSNPNFLIEEFVESDPVAVPQFANKLYDGTMRVVFFLTYNNGIIDITFLEGHWKLPKKSITDEGSLTEKHKSFGEIPHFLDVDPEVWQNVQDQLREGLPEFYRLLLGVS